MANPLQPKPSRKSREYAATESSSLLKISSELEVGSGASSLATTVNLVKVCIGTGALALPFAVSQGGFLVGTVGLALVAGWNQYACWRIDVVRQLTSKSSYASTAEAIFGPWARILVDICTISTLFGVCVVYTITFGDLVHATPFTLGSGESDNSTWREILLFGAISLPLSLSPHMKFLANTSIVGLVALVFGFGAIFVYGAQEYSYGSCAVQPNFAPASAQNFSNWFGACGDVVSAVPTPRRNHIVL
jgi:amino acid permease